MTERNQSPQSIGFLVAIMSFLGSVAGFAIVGIQIGDRLYFTASQGAALDKRVAVLEAKQGAQIPSAPADATSTTAKGSGPVATTAAPPAAAKTTNRRPSAAHK